MSQRFTDAELAAEYWQQLYVAEHVFTHRMSVPADLWIEAQRKADYLRALTKRPHAHPENQ